MLGLALVFAGATSHAISIPSIPPVSHSHPHLLGDGLTTYRYDSEGRLESASTGQGEDAPTTKYAYNALGQRVFKTEPLYSGTQSSSAGNKTGKNLNNLLADDEGAEPAQAEQPGLVQWLLGFWSRLWSPGTSDAEKLGFSYVYAEDGSLLGEYGSGGTNSSGTAQYLYLPTASGPLPIAAVIKGTAYAIHSDHLDTPRKLTQADGQTAWQWAYSAFGDEQPTIGAKRFTSESTNPTTGATSIPEVTFNLRYPGQYFDKETKLHYNYHRSYAPGTGRYTQGDPIGLDGGFNRFAYVRGNPLKYTDPLGLFGFAEHVWITNEATGGDSDLAKATAMADFLPGSQEPKNSYWHAMRDGTGPQTAEQAQALFHEYIERQLGSCSVQGLARALHALQDSFAAGHRDFQPWAGGVPGPEHLRGDVLPSQITLKKAVSASKALIEKYKQICECKK
ncbi:MAG: hypothetical protein IV104_14045 [Acidovorax sp.]|nr:hypothetical protein [Acidovorax sp.]